MDTALQTYLVGGAVRDALLGLPVHDRDWVVVGASPDIMRQRGFTAVGRDFPVFLHPHTREEYALARTERKIGRGYAGFSFDTGQHVTLEQDLSRRDLTINAMAQDADGKLIDPFGGADDLRQGILRHVGAAFVEDPVRILRTARFAARYGFTVAPETMQLMREMVANGEVDALVAERVWQEWAKGLMENHPRRMLAVLRECGALSVLLPEVDALFGVAQRSSCYPENDCGEHALQALQRAADWGLSLPERYAALLHGLAAVDTVNQRWRVPKDCAQLAEQVCALHIRLHQVGQVEQATALLDILKQADALRRPQRFEQMLNVCQAIFAQTPYPQRAHGLDLLAAAQSVDAGAIAQAQAGNPQHIAAAIDQARAAAMHPVQRAYQEKHHYD